MPLALVAAAAASVATRPRDPPVPPADPDGPAPFAPTARPPLLRPLPPGPPVVDEAALEVPAPGVALVDLQEGVGDPAFPGHVATVEFTAWRVDGGVVESTAERVRPVRWALGREGLPLALDALVGGMRPGGIRLARLEPDAAYGGLGLPGTVPPGTGVWALVELVALDIPPERMPSEGGELRAGSGPAWRPGLRATLDYALWSARDPTKPVDDSLLRWYPHAVGPGDTVPGLLRDALDGLRPGGVRVVRGPAGASFGPAGRPPLVEPGDDLVLRVELHTVEEAGG